MTIVRGLPPLGARHGAAPPEAFRVGAQRTRMALRLTLALIWTVPLALVQTVLIALPGKAKRVLPLIYWSGVSRILGLERRVIGRLASGAGRPVLFVANHTSWLDIPALGGVLPACFVAKAEVGRWPGVRIVAYLGRTVFVSRRASETGRERGTMQDRLAAGDNLLLFPEGTSSDGVRVLPFRSPFFAAAETGAAAPLIQPVSIVFDTIDGLPATRFTRPTTSWYGDMDLGSHFWRLAAHRRLRATILLHEPIDPAAVPSRKALARATWQVVADGSAALRRQRPGAFT